MTANPSHNAPHQASRPSVAGTASPTASPSSARQPDASPGEHPLLTRRRFLYGAAGVGAAAALGIGALAVNASHGGADEISYLEVPESALTSLSDLTALDGAEGKVQLVGSFDIPYGSLVWANDEAIAACLLPTESGSPLAQVGLLFLGSGQLDTVVETAQGAADGFEIYDARANSAGVVWTEANILQGTWRIYAAPLIGGAPGQASLLDEGDESLETPTLAVAQDRAFWQVLPKTTEKGVASRLMSARFDGGDAKVVLESARRMATPVYGGADFVTVSPRLDAPSTFHRLMAISAADGGTLDTLTLPAGMKPLEAGYGANGFMFSFSAIYDYGGGISNLGTYTPFAKPADGDYNAAQWFDFARTPTAPPAWCGNLLVVKSTYSVCGVDLRDGTYFALDVENGADTYGEYLASTGVHDTFVTYTNIDHTPIGAEHIHTCRVKVWSSLI